MSDEVYWQDDADLSILETWVGKNAHRNALSFYFSYEEDGLDGAGLREIAVRVLKEREGA